MCCILLPVTHQLCNYLYHLYNVCSQNLMLLYDSGQAGYLHGSYFDSNYWFLIYLNMFKMHFCK